MKNYGKALAEVALEIKAIKFSPEKPFCWASGYYMPIYNDNRMLLGRHAHRHLVAEGFAELIHTAHVAFDVVSGVATAGIAPATTLADYLKAPLVYVRAKAKDHGLQNRIEGILRPGERVVLIEDVVSTGGSSVDAVQAIRDAGGLCDTCLCIFSYGFRDALATFEKASCRLIPILTYSVLLETAKERNYLNDESFSSLAEWQNDPFGWGAKRGFARRESGKS